MYTNRYRALITAVIFSGLVTPLTGFAHEPVDTLHATPIETVGSRLASPTEIHVQVTSQGVEVKGALKRSISRKRQSLRGHVDIELLDVKGQVIELVTLPIRSRPGSAKHDHKRRFSAVLPLPETKEFSIRVRHSTGGDKHEQMVSN